MENNITADIRFAILPEWVLAADVSDRAIRLYAILARYADNETLQAFPSRETLAKRARCNAKAVTRAVNELVSIGAVVKHYRKNGDAYQSNIYTLRRVAPGGATGRVNGGTGVGSDLTLGGVSNDSLTRTTELEPLNYIFDEFWKIYPKKTDKALAKRSMEKALRRATAERILGGARKYRDDPRRDDAYTKNPSTWLNADAWDNEYVEPKKTPGPGRREWVRSMHAIGEHWACEPGEFQEGCD
jgi:uncharacterized protein (DUF4415 family)